VSEIHRAKAGARRSDRTVYLQSADRGRRDHAMAAHPRIDAFGVREKKTARTR